MIQHLVLAAMMVLLSSGGTDQGNMPDYDSSAARIVAISEKMIHAIEGMGDFSCEVEIHYYRQGQEHKRYRFTFSLEKKGITRIKFSRPYPGLTASYIQGDTMITVQPLPFLPFVKFRCSLYHNLVRSPSGQRMDQASIEYLSRFFYNSITSIQQKEHSISDGQDTVEFTFWAQDYIEGLEINRYHVVVAKDTWLPRQIERYDQLNQPIEVIIVSKFASAAGQVHASQRGFDKKSEEKYK